MHLDLSHALSIPPATIQYVQSNTNKNKKCLTPFTQKGLLGVCVAFTDKKKLPYFLNLYVHTNFVI